MDYRLEQLRFELREDPSSRIFFKLGEHLRREGELDEAVEVLRTGLKQHTRYVAAWVSLGRAQLDNGDTEGARAALERALQLDPENAVAARAMGEAAIIDGDWLTAVKALKRARGLSPQDDALDERISFVEARLAELGLLKTPSARVENRAQRPADGDQGSAAGEEPFAVRSAGDTGVWDDANDVFAAGWVEEKPASEESGAGAEGEAPPDTTGNAAEDSGAYVEPPPLTDDDVASMVGVDGPVEGAEPAVVVHEEEPAAEAADPKESAFIAPEPESDVETEPEAEPAFEPEPEPEPAPRPGAEPEPLPESWPDPEPDLEKGADGLPLPTMTLARLAIDQGDLDLAERTLRGVLEREPGHSEATQLLNTLIAGPPKEDSAAQPRDPADAKTEALQRWLNAVRLASERLKT